MVVGISVVRGIELAGILSENEGAIEPEGITLKPEGNRLREIEGPGSELIGMDDTGIEEIGSEEMYFLSIC